MILYSFLYLIVGTIIIYFLNKYFNKKNDMSTAFWDEFSNHRIFVAQFLLCWPFWILCFVWTDISHRLFDKKKI